MKIDVCFNKDDDKPICPECGTPLTKSNESPNGGVCKDCGEDKQSRDNKKQAAASWSPPMFYLTVRF